MYGMFVMYLQIQKLLFQEFAFTAPFNVQAY